MNNSLKRFSNFTFIIIFIYLLPITAICQNIVSGVVTESNGNPIEGANVYFEGNWVPSSPNDVNVTCKNDGPLMTSSKPICTITTTTTDVTLLMNTTTLGSYIEYNSKI